MICDLVVVVWLVCGGSLLVLLITCVFGCGFD